MISLGELGPSDTAIIREVYDSDNAPEIFEMELERALQVGCRTIVIEPTQLGEDTARWLMIGNLLHKTALLSGCGSFALGFIWPEKRLLPLPFGIVALFCSSLYMINWQFDPCGQYRVEKSKSMERSNKEIMSKKAITLTRKHFVEINTFSNLVSVHAISSLFAFGFCYWKLSGSSNCQPDKAVVGIAL